MVCGVFISSGNGTRRGLVSCCEKQAANQYSMTLFSELQRYLFSMGYLAGLFVVWPHPIFTTMYLLPGIALLAAKIAPQSEFVHATFFGYLTGPVRMQAQSEATYHLMCAAWWTVASLILPISLSALRYSISQHHLFGDWEVILAVPLPIVGLVCGVVSVLSLSKAVRAAVGRIRISDAEKTTDAKRGA